MGVRFPRTPPHLTSGCSRRERRGWDGLRYAPAAPKPNVRRLMKMQTPFPNMLLPPEITYEFLGTFARCEYALKGSGFARGSENSVEANWDEFALSIDQHFSAVEDPAFKEAVSFLLAEPPRKQVLRDGQVDWKDAPPDRNLPQAQQVLLMVRRIRNNLFHGAKIWSPEYNNRERDIKLVKAGLIVMKQCIQISHEVHIAYEVGAF